MKQAEFRNAILQGIPKDLPPTKPYDYNANHAPIRKDILSKEQKKLALKNALRYFAPEHHSVLAKEFAEELEKYGRIYMYRFKPEYEMYARPIDEYPHKSKQAASIMHMIQNNLDPRVAQHPYELITYGGNGAVFQNWVQYLLTMQYLAEMTEEQTLSMYSGHPMGLFPSNKDAPRVVITNGMVIPNYSSANEYEKLNALGVSQYGQMTAGSYMYIGPQGIVHGTTITLLNAARLNKLNNSEIPIFVSSGLGGMSGAQPKAAKIAGMIGIIAELNPKAVQTRYAQGWVDEVYDELDELCNKVIKYKKEKKAVSIAYKGNIIDLWKALLDANIHIDIGSDQTSLHNPFSGGYYPVGTSFEESNKLIFSNPELFKAKVYESLIKHVALINEHTKKGMYFFDYGNAFLLESSRAGADILNSEGNFKYPSYVQDIMGPLCFDYGFGPFRWVCTSANPLDLEKSDQIAAKVLKEIQQNALTEIQQQLDDNIIWIEQAWQNKLVVGSQARILYADAEGRIAIALALNKAIKDKFISAPIVLGRDHHDVSGTDSPYRETSNIYDGSAFTADMAIHNVIGDAFRGATWVSIHNGGGVGWGEVINGGFGMLIDGSKEAETKIKNMLFWDVNNGIARRNWARNPHAMFAIEKAMKKEKRLKVKIPNQVDDKIIDSCF